MFEIIQIQCLYEYLRAIKINSTVKAIIEVVWAIYLHLKRTLSQHNENICYIRKVKFGRF